MEFTRNYFKVGYLRVQWFCPYSEISNAHYMLEVSINGKYFGYYEDGFHSNI